MIALLLVYVTDVGNFLRKSGLQIVVILMTSGALEIYDVGNIIVGNAKTIEKYGRLYLKLQVTRSTRLGSSILCGRIEDIGKIRLKRTLVNLNADRKRFWFGKLKSVEDGLSNDSLSLSLNYFGKDEI